MTKENLIQLKFLLSSLIKEDFGNAEDRANAEIVISGTFELVEEALKKANQIP
jgi:hypothetical protein